MTKQQILVEKLADIEHERWSDWQSYVHSKMYELGTNQNVSHNVHLKIMPTELWDRWERQMRTPYSQLSKAEQQSDIKQVVRYFPLIVNYVNEMVSEYMKALDGVELPEEVWKKLSDVNRDYLLENLPTSNVPM